MTDTVPVARRHRRRASDRVRRAGAKRWLLGCEVGGGVRVNGPVLVRGSRRIVIVDYVEFDARQTPIELHARAGALVSLGAGA